jgi:glycosyltransferase involved in cell wall biosynthesis
MKKKICFIVATPVTARSFLLKHFEYLSQEFDVYLVANFENNSSVVFSIPHIKDVNNIGIQRNISIFKDLAALFSLIKYLKEMQFDAVHTVTPKAGLIGILAAKLAGIRVRIHIFTGQVWHTKKGIFKILLKNIDRFIVCFATHILVDGESQRQFLIKNKIIKETNSKVLGKGSISGVDTDKFVPNEDIRDKYRKELHITSEVVFLFLGRMNLDKGILDLAHAFSKLNEEFSNSRLVLVGPDEQNLQPKVLEIFKNSKSVIFYGPTDKPEDVLQMADVFCLPSHREGFGTSIIEASLLELPVICSDTYGLMETIVENETGLRHEVANVTSIFEEMEKLQINIDLRKYFGRNGRQYVLKNFSADIISEQWVKFYKEIVL